MDDERATAADLPESIDATLALLDRGDYVADRRKFGDRPRFFP